MIWFICSIWLSVWEWNVVKSLIFMFNIWNKDFQKWEVKIELWFNIKKLKMLWSHTTWFKNNLTKLKVVTILIIRMKWDILINLLMKMSKKLYSFNIKRLMMKSHKMLIYKLVEIDKKNNSSCFTCLKAFSQLQNS
jgi:hypothetical protein